jgi:hypothetical protein
MKALSVAVLLLLFNSLHAQLKLTPGNYVGGGWECNLKYNTDGAITLVDATYTHTYKPVGNTFSYVHTNGVDYRILPLDNKTFKVYHEGTPDNFTRYTYIGGGSVSPNPEEASKANNTIEYKKIAEKYRDKMKADSKDAQMYAFCAAAALARASYNEEAFNTYAKRVVASLKQIMVNKAKCPCEDAIPQTIWNSVPQ